MKGIDVDEVSNDTKQLIDKFKDFLKSTSERNGVNTQTLAKTMRKYIKELNEDESSIKSRSTDKRKKKKMSQYEMNVYYKLNLLKDLDNNKGNTRREIRKMLHPTISEDQLPDEKESLISTNMQLNSLFKKRLKYGTTPRFYSRYKEFNKLPETNFDVPVITNSSPYISEEQVYRKEFLENKQGWLYNEFKTYFSKASKTDNFIQNYVTMTPSEPPLLHKFRVVQKKKWIDHDFKF